MNQVEAKQQVDSYSYEEATKRNIGILTQEEQNKLRNTRVSVPGVGGLGGTQIMILARLGIQNFNIADFDRYDVSNLNRQYGATVDTIGVQKVEVMKNHILSINPNAVVTTFNDGLNKNNVKKFVTDADILLDAIDLTAMSIREILYDEARRQNKYVIACGPIGYGFFCLIMHPKGKAFAEIFNIKPSHTDAEKMQIFLQKLTPSMLHEKYMDKALLNPNLEQNGTASFSWISPAIFMAAGNGIAELIKIVLNKGETVTAPMCYQYDAYMNKMNICMIQ